MTEVTVFTVMTEGAVMTEVLVIAEVLVVTELRPSYISLAKSLSLIGRDKK